MYSTYLINIQKLPNNIHNIIIDDFVTNSKGIYTFKYLDALFKKHNINTLYSKINVGSKIKMDKTLTENIQTISGKFYKILFRNVEFVNFLSQNNNEQIVSRITEHIKTLLSIDLHDTNKSINNVNDKCVIGANLPVRHFFEINGLSILFRGSIQYSFNTNTEITNNSWYNCINKNKKQCHVKVKLYIIVVNNEIFL